MNLSEAKHAVFLLCEGGYNKEIFQYIVENKSRHQILDKRPLRKEIQKHFNLTKEEAKERLCTLLNRLQELGLGETKKTIEGKQFIFTYAIISEHVGLSIRPEHIQNWIEEIGGLRLKPADFKDLISDLARLVTKTSCEVKAELEGLTLSTSIDLWTYILSKYGVTLEPKALLLSPEELANLIVITQSQNYLTANINRIGLDGLNS